MKNKLNLLTRIVIVIIYLTFFLIFPAYTIYGLSAVGLFYPLIIIALFFISAPCIIKFLLGELRLVYLLISGLFYSLFWLCLSNGDYFPKNGLEALLLRFHIEIALPGIMIKIMSFISSSSLIVYPLFSIGINFVTENDHNLEVHKLININKNQKRFTPIMIALVVLLLVGVGGTSYYFINKQFQKQIACTAEAKICPDGSSVGRTGPNCEFTACPEVKIDEIAGWNNYMSDKYGFEIKYPKDWLVDDRYGVIKILSPEWQKSIEAGKKSEYSIYYKDNTCAYCYNISIHFEAINETLEEYITKNSGGYENPTKIEFAGENGYRVVELGEKIINGILIKKDNYLYDIGLVPGNKTEAVEKTENQILSTFKFLH
ncbi:MAG: hypothetical protein WC998_02330 [Candidatus Paceibacterota bacterium]|jgi:hypothetical protein